MPFIIYRLLKTYQGNKEPFICAVTSEEDASTYCTIKNNTDILHDYKYRYIDYTEMKCDLCEEKRVITANIKNKQLCVKCMEYIRNLPKE